MVLRIGHKGCYKNPNRIDGILHAINELKVDIVEIDVRLTKDNILILFHDNGFEDLEIYNYTFDEISKYLEVDKLEDALNAIPDNVQIYLDIKKSSLNYKNSYNSIIKNELIKMILSRDYYYNLIIASFDHDLVRDLLKEAINNKLLFLKTCYITHEFPSSYLSSYLSTNDIDYLSVNISSLTSEMLRICKNNNISLLVYTVNNRDIIDNLIELGVDGIVSDYPDRIIK